MIITTVFFDMDGVIVLTEPLHLRAWKEYCKVMNIKPLRYLCPEELTGLSDKKIAQTIKELAKLDYTHDEMILSKNKIFRQLLASEKLSPPPGRDEFLSYVAKYKKALVSSSSLEVIRRVLDSQGLEHYFDLIISNEDSSEHKPDPAPYLLALEKTDSKTGQTITIEDSPAGIRASVQAGINTCALLSSFNSLDDFGQKIICKDFFEVKNWFLAEAAEE